MNINRNNYEEYFILYADKELSALQRAAVEDFLSLNPDLKPELESILQAVLPAEALPSFSGKESLFRTNGEEIPVNLLNYASYFLLYADDELSNTEKAATELFLYRHPEFQSEFELIQQCRLEPETSISFPDKALLYRKTESRRRPVIGLWPRLSAAAILLLVAGLIWRKHQPIVPATKPPLANQPVKPATGSNDSGQNNNALVQTPEPSGKSEASPATVTILHAQPKIRPAGVQSSTIAATPKATGDQVHPLADPGAAAVPDNLAKLPSPQPLPAPDAVAATGALKPSDIGLVNAPDPSLTTRPADEDYVYVDNTGDNQPKKRFRSLLRKTSRYVEQNSPANSQRKRTGVFTASYEQ